MSHVDAVPMEQRLFLDTKDLDDDMTIFEAGLWHRCCLQLKIIPRNHLDPSIGEVSKEVGFSGLLSGQSKSKDHAPPGHISEPRDEPLICCSNCTLFNEKLNVSCAACGTDL
jgi:hypothetical protein